MEADVVVNLSTAIATIGVMVALFVRIDKRIDGVEMRIDRLDSKFETKFGKTDVRFDKMDARFEDIEAGVEGRFDRADARFGERFDRVDVRFDKMDGKFEAGFHRTDAKIDAMARDIVDVKVSVARIEGFLEAREGFIPVGTNRPGSEPTAESSLLPATAKPANA